MLFALRSLPSGNPVLQWVTIAALGFTIYGPQVPRGRGGRGEGGRMGLALESRGEGGGGRGGRRVPSISGPRGWDHLIPGL